MLQISLDSPRVLVIESDPLEVSRIRVMSEDEASGRFNVVAEAASLASGIELLKVTAVDVVLVALSLPDSAGLENFRQVHHVVPEMPIVLLVSQAEEGLARQAVQSGAQEYLLKERMDAFLVNRAMHHALERNRYQAEFARERGYLRTLLDNIPDRIYFKDEQSRFIRINSSLTKPFGLNRPEDA